MDERQSITHETTTMMATPATRTKALSLYRQLLRGAEKMPTPNRRKFVAKKTRTEFKANKSLSDPEEISFCIRLADTNLDTVLIQAEHLNRLMKDPNYHADI
jgi:Complex 1 protein (LYR family)